MYSLSVYVLASNEREQLRQTIDSIYAQGLEDFCVTVVLKSADCPAAEELQRIRCEGDTSDVAVYVQKADQLEAALAETAALCQTTHMVVLAADMEMDPNSLKRMVQISRANPDAIVCASKWHKASQISGYNTARRIWISGLNRLLALPYKSKGHDLISFYQIMPRTVIQQLTFSETYRFLYEYTLLPLRAGVPYMEIPTTYHKRTEEKSNFSFYYNCKAALRFLSTSIYLLLTPKKKLFKLLLR